MSEDISASFKSIGHPIRVQILLILADHLNNGFQFSELSRELQIESSGKLSFHLEKLDTLLSQDKDGRYYLNDQGKRVVEAIRLLGVKGYDNKGNLEEIIKSDITVSKVDEVSTERREYNYGLTFLIGILYQTFVVLLIPVIIIAILAPFIGDTALLAGFLLMSLASISLGLLIYWISKRNNNPTALEDIGMVIVASASITVFNIILFEDLLFIFLLIMTYLFAAAGVYLASEFNSAESWENGFIFNVGLKKSRYAVGGVFVLFLLLFPWYDHGISIRSENGLGSDQFFLFSPVIGMYGIVGLFSSLFILNILYSITKTRNFSLSWKSLSIFIIWQVIHFFTMIRSLPYSDVLNRADAWTKFIFDLVTGLAFLLGSTISIRLMQTHFNAKQRGYS